MEKIEILHTNDLHSHFENWPRIARYLQAEQAQNPAVFTFDIGDAIDRLNPLTDATMGRANVELMNTVHYNAVTIGNNEGLVLSHANLNRLYDQANFDVLLANFKELPENNQPAWAQPYQIYTSPAGTKIAVIGLTAPYELTYRSLNWQPLSVDETLSRYVPILHQEADIVVLLSHLGLPTDEELAEKFDLDLILGAHTHHVLPEGKLINGTMLAAAGRYGSHVGRVDLTVNAQHQLVACQAQAIPSYELAEEVDDLEQVRSWLQAGSEVLKARPVADLPEELSASQQGEAAMTALKEIFQVPAAMVSTGMFVNDLLAGPLNQYDLLESMPHSINPMLVTLSGRELKQLMDEIDQKATYLLDHPMKGNGFRGKVFGEVMLSGIERNHTGQILYQGQPINDRADYQLATLDHYHWIEFFPVLDDARLTIKLGTLLREFMADYYQRRYGFKPEKE
ncbi:bifunctional metallophosphatase/5'-nucleotidase [Convivina intestini]|uniref:2',3'-cyclic-nucleotide 2'-phosphodiesterase (5'-nucleotidase family) n=1 Tax=Convivina intestini TaxID=1505726 RepID=A0A2U1DEK1_9LACO|nr:bifunctional UDP-sugar hydrolase/5'-nucleotidase [Convivina intestini]PVY86110.1 2',3'-cyclic-nucleotide 2'-phosphodiesterase (5'-nucleotidase family) [Convivina intestini]CAH1851461.1 Mannosylglucosyl-3-phosphoglycerate phosphatase [Convivina intestini]CAH1853068.1 Mannosylglucosyl-3-phosphoglycerate phosphatase [Convivina intestini]SDB80847.1 2',3'-cyclic-nucleotide 2'-phosphodiesterase/5'-or 3'-nucleotidase, 5'-nucleotidase family [Leuconostocaceae bacterium R-53105]